NAETAEPQRMFLFCEFSEFCVNRRVRGAPSTRSCPLRVLRVRAFSRDTTINAETAEPAENFLFCEFSEFCLDRRVRGAPSPRSCPLRVLRVRAFSRLDDQR